MTTRCDQDRKTAEQESLPRASPGEGFTNVKPRRRYFHTRDKLRILDLADKCADENQLGLLLRREGIYSQQLDLWRTWKMKIGEQVPTDSKTELRNENARLTRRVLTLEARLTRAEYIIEIQKKVSEMLNLPPIDEPREAQP